LKATFGEETMRTTKVFEWFSKIKSGVNSAENPYAQDLVLENKRITIKDVTNMLEISSGSVQTF
jgi:hypothetical protein